jgi:hypothetical protein
MLSQFVDTYDGHLNRELVIWFSHADKAPVASIMFSPFVVVRFTKQAIIPMNVKPKQLSWKLDVVQALTWLLFA